ncbi:glucose-induced degradation complex subunit vid28 [Pichia californica]|uniref:Glucose-induced degradation complex subunit vid28 n=1 Tax=Pichia californica TaxID=460514 RepID=A0A9P6WLA4_9ASCO|nr:glucose-induced degradation complex subunit vid28 [[Candida] californica]KAG0687788.1 glucose-induced degradation complex subunit vid28 [[Candida] californica]
MPNHNKELPDHFLRLYEWADQKTDDTENQYNMQMIKSALIKNPDFQTIEKHIIHFINNYEINNDNNLTIEYSIDDMIIPLMVLRRESLFSVFCNKMISYCRDTGTTLLYTLDKKTITQTFLHRLFLILDNDSTPDYTSNLICKFILLIEPRVLSKNLQREIIRIIKKKYSKLWGMILSENNYKIQNFQHGYQSISLNSIINYYSVSLSQYLFLYAHIISIKDEDNKEIQEGILKLPKILLLGITVLSSSHNFEISWAATSVLIEYTKVHDVTSHTINHLESTVLNLISKEISNKIFFYNIISKYNIPLKHIPLSLLVKLLNNSPTLSDSLNDQNYITLIESIIDKDYNNESKEMTSVEAYKFSMCLTIMSFLSSTQDSARLSVSKGININKLIKNSLTWHNKILKAFSDLEFTATHLNVLEVSNRLTYASCLVLRSLSRSASFLRTYFTEIGLIDTLMEIISFDTNILANTALMNENIFSYENSLHILVLGVLSNLVIEFSYSKDKINVDELLKILSKIFENPKCEDKIIASLSIIRNALFGANHIFKDKFKDIIGLSKIFELCNNTNKYIKIQSFNVLRNLLAYSNKECDIVYNNFNVFFHDDFVDFLSKQLENSSCSILDVSICYCLVHFSASNVNNKISILKNKLLLNNLLKVLMKPLNKENEENFWEAKTAVAWIIINLTFKDGNSNIQNLTRFSDNEAIELFNISNRSNLLINMRFQETLKDLAEDCPSQDFTERAGKAIFQIMVSTNIN